MAESREELCSRPKTTLVKFSTARTPAVVSFSRFITTLANETIRSFPLRMSEKNQLAGSDWLLSMTDCLDMV
jgi:hypothetical protein